MIYDLIVAVLAVILVIVGIYRGAVRTLLNIVFSFLSYIGGMLLGGYLAEWIYASFIRPSILTSVSTSVSDLAAGTVTSTVDSLPSFVRSLLALSGQDIEGTLSGGIGSMSDQAANAVESAIGPIVISLLSFLLTIVLFFLFSFLLRKIVLRPIVRLVDRIPVVRGVNRFFGGVLGLIDAAITVCIIAALLKILLPYVGSETNFLNESTIYNSYIFYHFYSGNIFTAISSLLA